MDQAFVQTRNNIISDIHEDLDNLNIYLKNEHDDLKWDRDITSYLWHEFSGDLPSYGWAMENSQSSLTLKASGCTPGVKRYVHLFCVP